MKNLILFARKRGGKTMADKLATEILNKPYDLSKMSPNYLYLYGDQRWNRWEREPEG